MSNLERRIKQHIKAQPHFFKASAHIGFENTLAKELAMLGIEKCEIESGAVYLTAKLESVWRAIALSRCARNFEMRVAEFHCENFGRLEHKIKSIAWELYLPQNCGVIVKAFCEKSRLYHEGAVEERVKEWVGEGGVIGMGVAGNTITILRVRIKDDICSVWLDLCGEPLHKRGERWVEDAPMQETLAASILLRANFAGYEKLIDPMAGSGVFSLEAAKWRSSSAVILNRDFDFAKMPSFREAAFNNFLQKAKQPFALKEGEKFEILCSDKNKKAIETIRHNVGMLPIHITQADFFSLPPEQNALLVLNPPYGKRLGKGKNLYREIGKKIEKDFSGCAFAIVCPPSEAANFEAVFGKGALDKVCSYNGGLKIAVVNGMLVTP